MAANPTYALQDNEAQPIISSTALWDIGSTQDKVDIIAGIIGMFREAEIIIQKEPEFYVEEIERVRIDNPEMFVQPLGLVFRALAVMYRDFDNGGDADDLISQVLGDEEYEEFVLNQEAKKLEDIYNEWKRIK